MPYVRFPLSLRHVGDLLHDRGINLSHKTVRGWGSRWMPGAGCWTVRDAPIGTSTPWGP
jgi:transposase-like protein